MDVWAMRTMDLSNNPRLRGGGSQAPDLKAAEERFPITGKASDWMDGWSAMVTA
jgi:hypothetical protein